MCNSGSILQVIVSGEKASPRDELHNNDYSADIPGNYNFNLTGEKKVRFCKYSPDWDPLGYKETDAHT